MCMAQQTNQGEKDNKGDLGTLCALWADQSRQLGYTTVAGSSNALQSMSTTVQGCGSRENNFCFGAGEGNTKILTITWCTKYTRFVV